MKSDTIPEAAKRLRDWVLETRHYGSLEVVDVEMSLDIDVNRELAVFFDLMVPVPDGAETWPTDDAHALFSAVNEKARELDLGLPWYVQFRPSGDQEYGDE